MAEIKLGFTGAILGINDYVEDASRQGCGGHLWAEGGDLVQGSVTNF